MYITCDAWKVSAMTCWGLEQVQEQVQGADKILSGQYLLSLPQAFQVVLIGKGGGEGTLLEI
jgi:hypothetical protein